MTSSRFGRIDRRRLVASSVVGGAAILASGQPPFAGTSISQSAILSAQDASSDVPMFRGNAARTGVMPGPGPDGSSGLEVLWTTEFEGYVFSSPVVIDGVMYFGYKDSLRALDVESGAERWQFATSDEILSSPAVADGVVYVAPYAQDIYAIDVESGAERWRFETGELVRDTAYLDVIGALSYRAGSSPAVVDGVVYVGRLDQNLYAVNIKDGTERWRFETGNIIVSSPAVVDGVVYIGSCDNNLYAVNAEDGKERWRFDTGQTHPFYIAASPAVVDGVVYLGTEDGHIIALNVEDGTERWRFTKGGLYTRSPVVVDGVVCVGHVAVSAEDGTERWRSSVSSDYPLSPVAVDGVVYIASGSSVDGFLYAMDVKDGKERWRFHTDFGIRTEPVVANGVVYVAGYSIRNGKELGLICAIGAKS